MSQKKLNTLRQQNEPNVQVDESKHRKHKGQGKIVVKKLDLKQLKEKSQIQPESIKTAKGKTSDSDRFAAIRIKSCDTIKFDKHLDCYLETDQNFVDDINLIAQKNRNVFGKILQLKEKKVSLTDQQCDQIDFIARKHYKANKMNESYMNKLHHNNSKDLCPCGCEKYQGKTISFFSRINDLKFLGSGTILIFMFINAFAWIMLTNLVIYGIFSIVTNLMGGQSIYAVDCTSSYCTFINNSADGNKIEVSYLLTIQWWLGFVVCVLWLLTTRMVKYWGKKKNTSIDKRLNSASDRAILIRNLPAGEFSQNQILEYFQRIWNRLNRQQKLKKFTETRDQNTLNQMQHEQFDDNGNNFKMKSIQIIYSIDFARKLSQKIRNLATKLAQKLQTRSDTNKQNKKEHIINNKQQYFKTKQELSQSIQILGDLRNKFLYDQDFRKSISSELCIVEFQTEKDKDLILNHFGKQKIGILTQLQQKIKSFVLRKQQSSLMFKGKYLSIQRAPQPSDLQWLNCQIPYSVKRTALLYVGTILFIFVIFGILFAIQTAQNYFTTNIHEDNKKNYQQILTIVNVISSIVLLIANKILWIVLAYFLQIEYNYTLSERITSHMNKALFAISMNVILLPIITNYFIKNQIYGTNGLSGLAFDYQISTLAIGLPIKLFDPLDIIKRICLHIRSIRNTLIRYLCKNITPTKQNYKERGIKQINELYQGSNFDVAESYVYILGTIYHTAFFCQLQPAVLIPGTITTILFYFVLKGKLFFFSKNPPMIDPLVFQTALSQVCLVPIIYGVGSIATSYIEKSINPDRPFSLLQGLLCIGLGFFVFFNPKNIFNTIVKRIMQKLGQCVQLIKQKKFNDKQKIDNHDNYYQKSNSLDLLGYQSTIKNSHLKDNSEKQLEKFCSQFFPKINQKIKRFQDQKHSNDSKDESEVFSQ